MQNRFKLLIYTEGIYVLVSVIFALYIKSSLHLMMGFNMVLALIPFLLTYWLEKAEKVKGYKFVLVFLLWLLFFPNTFYFLTDLIHITQLNIYDIERVDFNSVIVYRETIVEWLKLAHLLLGALGGALLGLASLYQMKKILEKRKVKYINDITIGIIVLSGVGIYIGRFLRFNSWDIFNPFKIIKTLVEGFNTFALLFIILTSGIIALLFYTFNYLLDDRLLKPKDEE